MSSIRPSSRPGGLPSNPRARSASRPRVPTDVDSAYSLPSEPLPSRSATSRIPADPRPLRSQRSLAGLDTHSHSASSSSARAPRPSHSEQSSESRSRSRPRASDEDDRRSVRERAQKQMPPIPPPSVDRARSRLRERPSVRSLRSTASSPVSETPSTFDHAPWDNSNESSPRTSLESAPQSKPGKSGLPKWVGNDDDYQLDEHGASAFAFMQGAVFTSWPMSF
jgi:hypothetical protein